MSSQSTEQREDMIDDEPSIKDMARLWNICARFIEQNEISVEKSMSLPEDVIEALPLLMDQILDEVGFYEEEP